MDHKIAVKIRAAERYLLGELTVAERDDYENHYFECPECAEEIRVGAALIDNARAELQIAYSPAPARRLGWFGWLQPSYAVAALVILLALLAYQNLFTIPRLKHETAAITTQPLTSFSFITVGSRGVAPPTITPPPGRPFGIYFDIPSTSAYHSYDCEIQSDTGKSKIRTEVSAEQAKDTVQLLISPGRLSTGNYVLVVRGKTGDGAQAEIVRYPFSLRVAE